MEINCLHCLWQIPTYTLINDLHAYIKSDSPPSRIASIGDAICNLQMLPFGGCQPSDTVHAVLKCTVSECAIPETRGVGINYLRNNATVCYERLRSVRLSLLCAAAVDSYP